MAALVFLIAAALWGAKAVVDESALASYAAAGCLVACVLLLRRHL